MGYGLKTGIWSGKKTLLWRASDDSPLGRLEEAFDIWEKKVGISFSKCIVANTTVDFTVKIGQGQSGWSQTLKQISLKNSGALGTALHEIGHLLGMSHEHDRPETRTKFYEPDTAKGGFGLDGAKSREANLQTYGPVDTESIMQYPESSYAGKAEPSAGDIAAVKAINGL